MLCWLNSLSVRNSPKMNFKKAFENKILPFNRRKCLQFCRFCGILYIIYAFCNMWGLHALRSVPVSRYFMEVKV